MTGAANSDRIITLDVVRGIAVMGILAMNIVAFAMPYQAYFNPAAYGWEGPADLAAWVFNFIFLDGRMRGLFSLLFGASALLVIERARTSGLSPVRIHYARMLWLLVFGLIHFYFIWFGDILVSYAVAGLLLFLFRDCRVRTLLIWAVSLIAAQFLLMGAGAMKAAYLGSLLAEGATDPTLIEAYQGFAGGFAPPDALALAHDLDAHRGAWSGLVEARLAGHGLQPFKELWLSLPDTLAYMLFGMAAFRSGFLTGSWSDARYRRWLVTGYALSVPVFALLAYLIIRADFTPDALFAFALAAPTLVRPAMVVAIAATIILLFRHQTWLRDRIAAAGRAAFTNYLGTSILMTTLFCGHGLGLYGQLSRAELWLPVLAMWLLILAWSKPWLERYRYGPLEWLWRSLSRGRLEKMRR